MHHPTDRITHTTAFVTREHFVTLLCEHWLEREIAQWDHPMKDRPDDPSHHERTLYLWATSRSPIERERQWLTLVAIASRPQSCSIDYGDVKTCSCEFIRCRVTVISRPSRQPCTRGEPHHFVPLHWDEHESPREFKRFSNSSLSA